MSFGKIHHWAMMGAMILMASAAAVATYGGSTSFLHIGWSYVKHIVVGGYEALGPALKGFGAAIGNLASVFGIDPGSLTAIDPATVSQAQSVHAHHGAGTAISQAAPPAAAAPLTGAEGHAAMGHTAAPAAGGLAGKFSSAGEWFLQQPVDLQQEFMRNASDLGVSLQDYVADFCDMFGAMAPGR